MHKTEEGLIGAQPVEKASRVEDDSLDGDGACDGRTRRLLERIAALEAERDRGQRALADREEALREADAGKNELLAMLSHELRNPLAPIKNSLFLLHHAIPGSEKAMRALAVIDRQVEQISRLVDDLLDVTRITRGRVDVEKRRLELNGLVRRVVEDHQGVFDRGGVRLSLQESRESLLVRGDAQRLAQVVGHLLLNAAKFTPQGGAARVVLAEDRETGHAVVRVVDSGVGVAPDILPRLFKPFVQVGAGLSRSKGGVGLGLALVKSVIDLHGGEVTAWSRGLSQGLEVVLTLPLDTGELEESRGARRSREPERARVLLIEDNIDAAETLRDAMELSDHEVRIAHDGPTGIEMAREFQPDIVFCDIGLPGMDGFAVARELRSDEALRGVFLVALTGYAQPEDRRLATSAGFDEHVPKPPVLRKLDVLISLAMSRAPVSSSL